jgi:hypothetical protein
MKINRKKRRELNKTPIRWVDNHVDWNGYARINWNGYARIKKDLSKTIIEEIVNILFQNVHFVNIDNKLWQVLKDFEPGKTAIPFNKGYLLMPTQFFDF